MNGLMHLPWLSTLGWTLLHSLWEGTLVALAAAGVLRGLKGASPRARYVVSVLALVLMAGLPLRHLATPRAATGPVSLERGRPLPGDTVVVVAAQSVPAPSPVLRTRLAGELERMLPWMVGAWAVGALLSLLRLAGGWAWLQRLRWRKAELSPDALQRQMLDLCRRAGLKRAVTLLTCEGLAGPSVVGVLRPAILVPAGWFLNLPPDHVEALLAHELAHVLRHDYAVNLLQSLLDVLLFYHPGVWWLSARIRAERELAADAFAARLLGDPFPLAQALTDLERRGLGRLNLEPAPAAHGGSLMERITALLLPRPRTSTAPAFGAAAVLTLLLASGLRLGAQAPDPTPSVAPAIPTQAQNLPKGVRVSSGSAFYLASEPAKDAEGKPVPYTQLLTVKADQMPLNQVWKAFDEGTRNQGLHPRFQAWAHRDEKVAGPRVNLDMEKATPAQVLAVLNGLAEKHGVAPYQAPASTDLKPFSITKHTTKEGKVLFDFHARQVSGIHLDKLFQMAKALGHNQLLANGAVVDGREKDVHPGPKVDALFEALTLEELEARIAKLRAEAQ